MQNVPGTVTIHHPLQPNNTTVQIYSGILYNLGKESVQIHCNSCNKEINTKVNGKVSSNGIIWATLCCCCGGPLSLWPLVLCLDGFKIYRHSCPTCNAFIGNYKPSMSGGMACFLCWLTVFYIVGLMFLSTYLFMTYYGAWLKRKMGY